MVDNVIKQFGEMPGAFLIAEGYRHQFWFKANPGQPTCDGGFAFTFQYGRDALAVGHSH
jgi:hypothetical protein